jgi:hypothetical protein
MGRIMSFCLPKYTNVNKRILYWLPRILSVLFIIFISLFALDAFSEPQWFLALFMHLIPSFILIILTAVTWKRELLGGCMFIVVGFLMLIFSHFPLIISLPVIMLGVLFVSGKYFYKK